MSLEAKIVTDLKAAMKAKDKVALRGIRAIKSQIILAKTDGSGKEIDEAAEIKMLQKMIKQRKDSISIYETQNRPELAATEKEEVEVIERYLPQQMGEAELTGVLQAIIAKTGATSMKDMGKIMGMASKQLGGKADGKTISSIVKAKLSS